MAPVTARGIGDWAVVGEEPGNKDVLPVVVAPAPAGVSAAESGSSLLPPALVRTAGFLHAAPLRL
jgi:hypothetical protein